MRILAPFELPPAFGLRQCPGAFESGRSYRWVKKRQSTGTLQDARAILHRLRKLALILAVSLLATSGLRADDWPQWLGPQRDGVWRETGIVEKLPTNGFTYRWRVPIGGGYTGPAVANGRVYLMDRQLATGTPVGAGPALSISHNLITATIGRVKSCPSPMLGAYGRAA